MWWWLSQSRQPDQESKSDDAEPVESAENRRAGSQIIDLQQSVGNQSVQRMMSDSSSSVVKPLTTSSSEAGGAPLPEETLEKMEDRFGADFGDVRIHSDAQAAESALGIDAEAYTRGRDIYFAPGKYAPNSPEGDRLLAHELTHVVQQDPAPDQRTNSFAVGSHDSEAEREAEVISHEVASGHAARPTLKVSGQPAQRQGGTLPQMAKVKELVREKDPTGNHELYTLIANNAMDGKPYRAFGPFPTIPGAGIHEWQLSISLDPNLGRTGATRGKTGDEVVAPQSGKIVHTIPITINTFLASYPEERTGFPDVQARMNRMAAEALLHELVHVRLKLGFPPPASAGQFSVSETITGLQKERAKLPGVAAEEKTVRDTTLGLILLGENIVGHAILPVAERSEFLRQTIDHLVEEKFAKQTAGRPFGLTSSISNQEIATAYGSQIEGTIRSLAPQPNTLGTNNQFNSRIQDLQQAIRKFYDGLDAQTTATPAPSGPSQSR